MFGKAELERLRLQKELLVVRCDANRLLLVAEWQRLRSPEFWKGETGAVARRHPLLTAALGLGAGIAGIQFLRRPAESVGWFRRMSSAGSTMLALWKLLRRL